MDVQKLISLARNQVGLKEESNNNDGKQIEKFTGGRKEPWCGHFVAWCFRQVKSPIPDDLVPSLTQYNVLANVEYMREIFQTLDQLYDEPKSGDIVFYETRGNSDKGPGHHCGIVESVEDKWFWSIEGNYGNKVALVKKSKQDKTLWGFGRMV